jgi:hypothetical protein
LKSSIKPTAIALEKSRGLLYFFRLADCWLMVSKNPEGPATGHLDTCFLGFPLFLRKGLDGFQFISYYCMLFMQTSGF